MVLHGTFTPSHHHQPQALLGDDACGSCGTINLYSLANKRSHLGLLLPAAMHGVVSPAMIDPLLRAPATTPAQAALPGDATNGSGLLLSTASALECPC